MKRKELYTITGVLVLLIVMFAAACGGGEGDNELVGAWIHTDVDVEVEFNSDGTMVMRGLGQEQQATYTVEDDTIDMVDPETGETVEIKYTVDGDTLTTDDGSSVDTFVRKGSDTTAGETETTASQSGDLATRENPIPLGQEAQVGDWNVTVVSVTLDATSSILAEDEFSDPPEEGSQYVLATVDATYTGTESSTFWMDMAMKFVGGKGNTFGSPEGFAVPPNPLWNVEEAFPGASISGDALFEVPSDQVSGGVLMVEPSFSVEGSRVFFAVE